MTKTGTWTVVGDKEQIWTAEYYVPNFKCRSVALLLKDNTFLVISPGESLLPTFARQLLPLGKPKLLLAPNSFHHLGIKAWQKQYPELKVVASKQSIPKLERQKYNNIFGLDLLRSNLPRDISILEPQGMRFGETWLQIQENEIIWVVCDAFFNMPRLSNRFIARTMQKILVAAPGLCISSIVKWFLIKNRSEYCKWVLAQIQEDNPTMLIPAHGDILHHQELSTHLQKLIDLRL